MPTCEHGHENPGGASSCGVCGAPVVDDDELQRAFRALPEPVSACLLEIWNRFSSVPKAFVQVRVLTLPPRLWFHEKHIGDDWVMGWSESLDVDGLCAWMEDVRRYVQEHRTTGLKLVQGLTSGPQGLVCPVVVTSELSDDVASFVRAFVPGKKSANVGAGRALFPVVGDLRAGTVVHTEHTPRFGAKRAWKLQRQVVDACVRPAFTGVPEPHEGAADPNP